MGVQRSKRRRWIRLVLWVAGILAGFPATGLAAAKDASGPVDPARTILDDNSLWRFHVTLRRPIVRLEDLRAAGKNATAPAVLRAEVPYRSYPGIEQLESPPPPAGWNGPDFHDSAWPCARSGTRLPGSVATAVFRPGIELSTGLLCLRGKFTVTDPSRVQSLNLELNYRGGAVVYLNGREIARQDLPEGAGLMSPAAPYPPQAFTTAAGKPVPSGELAKKRIAAGDKKLAECLAARERRMGPIAVRVDALRRGVNVLAIELHRSDYHPAALSWFSGQNVQQEYAWTPIGLSGVRLTAVGDVSSNVAHPSGLRIWNHDVNDRVNVSDSGDPNETLQPILLTAARNGFFSAQVVVGSGKAIRGLRVANSEFVAEGGKRIPAAEVQVRYPVANGRAYQQPDWFDGLEETPPDEVPVHPKSGAAVQPVWITVHVPPQAAAGLYRGSLKISIDGEPQAMVPIHLQVADWKIPDPKQFRTYVGIYQSPTSVALQYRVNEWSEQHWKLLEQSLRLLGQVGNKIVNIPLSDQTQFGNDDGMVYWVRRADGTFDYDFTVLDRYLGLVKRYFGVPDFVALQVWHAGGWDSRGAAQRNTVTVVDKPGGKREHLQVPKFGTDESKRFWRPVLAAIHERLTALGMEQSMCLGILSDGTADPEVFQAFAEILPGGARWTRGCHSATREPMPYPLKGGGTVVCHEYCYGMAMANPAKGLPPVWKQRAWPGVAFIRHNFDDTLSLLKYRTMPERSLYCGTRGLGRIGLDFWDVLENPRAETRNIYNRWPASSCAQRAPNLFRLAYPGPHGAVATVRLEQLREGVQEAEAMIVVAEALGEHADQVGPELAARCRQILVERIQYSSRTCPEHYGRITFRTDHLGWQENNARLFAAAAEVSTKEGM